MARQDHLWQPWSAMLGIGTTNGNKIAVYCLWGAVAEVDHLWLGRSNLTSLSTVTSPDQQIEKNFVTEATHITTLRKESSLPSQVTLTFYSMAGLIGNC